jgi:AcrR family transcriptional regulator
MVQKPAGTAPVRGRPRGFDPQEVLGRVRDTFWAHGFAGTSMDQLSAATGLHKPSLYGAFGDKKALYMETLQHYRVEARAQFALAFAIPRLMDSLADVLERSILLFTREGQRGGCFMMSTAIPVAGEDADVQAFVRGSMEALDRALTGRFERAIADGELASDADVAGLTRIVVSGHGELSMRARAGFSRDELRGLATQTLKLVRKVGGIA